MFWSKRPGDGGAYWDDTPIEAKLQWSIERNAVQLEDGILAIASSGTRFGLIATE
jgi:hypothetical protein